MISPLVRTRTVLIAAASAFAAVIFMPVRVLAAGSNMPWEQPLQQIL